MNLELIQAFDEFLKSKKLTFEGVAIGGGALIILEVISRVTRDIDVLSPEIPENIHHAAVEFAQQEKRWGLKENWLNNGPISLQKDLGSHWQLHLQEIFRGKSLILYTLGKADLLKTKLFAYCDRTEPDFQDLINMKPTSEEIDQAKSWVLERDMSPLWPNRVETAFADLKKALGYE